VLTLDDAERLTGSTLTSSDGPTIGEVVDVYIDAGTHRLEWALVRLAEATGGGSRHRFVPLVAAQWTGGGAPQVPYSPDLVAAAPDLLVGASDVADQGQLSQDQEAQLYSHPGPSSANEPVPPGVRGRRRHLHGGPAEPGQAHRRRAAGVGGREPDQRPHRTAPRRQHPGPPALRRLGALNTWHRT